MSALTGGLANVLGAAVNDELTSFAWRKQMIVSKLTGGREFAACTAGLFDGFRLDSDGRIWTSAGDGVHCYDPDGTLIGRILLPFAGKHLRNAMRRFLGQYFVRDFTVASLESVLGLGLLAFEIGRAHV